MRLLSCTHRYDGVTRAERLCHAHCPCHVNTRGTSDGEAFFTLKLVQDRKHL